MGFDPEGYEKTKYMGEENIKKDTVPMIEQRILRKRTEQELCRDLDIVAGIKKKRLEWIGHVVRMEDLD